MNKQYNKNKITNSAIFKTLMINLIFVVGMLLVFQEVEKIDDYRMKFALAGAVTGEPDPHLLYSNIYLGYGLVFLTKLIPCISWYEMTQYIALFGAFCVMTYLIVKKKCGISEYAILAAGLFVFGYECYIKVTFSKTAGIASAAGMILFLNILYEKNLKQKKNIIKIPIACFLIVIGAFLRFKVFMMIFAVSMYLVIYRACIGYWEAGKGNRIKWIKKAMVPFCMRMLLILLVFVSMYGLKKSSDQEFNKDEGWKAYDEYNGYKVELQDYGWPVYKKNQEAYEKLGISFDDYRMWNNRDYSDPERFTLALMKSVIEMKKVTTKSSNKGMIEKVKSFLKIYPRKFLEEQAFWPVFLMIAFVVCSRKKYSLFYAISTGGMIMLVNFYFFLVGRYGQHHVDVGIWFLIAIMLFSILKEGQFQSLQKVVLPITILFLVWFVYDNYEYMSLNTYYNKNREVTIEEAQEVVEYISSDAESLYVTSNIENRYAYQSYGVLEQIPSKMYHNIYCLADYMYPSNRAALDNYGVYNIYPEMIDNEHIYYFQSCDVESDRLEEILNYIRTNYCESVYAVRVKEINGVGIYRFCSQAVDTNGLSEVAN